jgi:hypothetical protein
MGSSFSISSQPLTDVARKIRAAGKGQRLAGEEGVVEAALIMDRDLKEIALNAGRPQRVGLFMQSRIGFQLGVRSGITAASVTTLIGRHGNVVVASVGTALRHVLANERGATVRAKGRALAIPTVNALTASGALSNRFAGLSSLRDARDPGGRKLFVVKTRGGAWLAGTSGRGAGTVTRNRRTGRFQRGGRLVLYFLLKNTVQIPARYMFRNARRRVEPVIAEAIGERVTVRVDEAFQ